MKNSLSFFVFLSILVFTGCSDDNLKPAPDTDETTCNWTTAADSSSRSLVKNFWNAQSFYFNNKSSSDNSFNYWPQAHGLDVLLDAYSRTNDAEYLYYIGKWKDGVRVQNDNTFLNNFYDDMEWNALAMLRAYQATGNEKWKLTVDTVWTNIKTGWNTTMDGGISWNKEMPYYKNTPANAPACILAARLYQQFGNDSDKTWALKIYSWLRNHLYESGTGWVFDGINRLKTGLTEKNQYTYNQGTFVGAALELYKITGDASYLRDAVKAADYAISTEINANDYLLKDEGAGDGGLFKGIFIRYYTQLIMNENLDSSTRKRYLQFLEYNAQALWLYGTNKQLVLFGTYWKTKPTNQTGLTEQLSGSMLLEAAALLKAKGFLD